MRILNVGRNSDNDIIVSDDPYVGRNHCQIVQIDDYKYTIVDLNSANGTYVNGNRISSRVELYMNDIVRIGNTTLPWQSYFAGNVGLVSSVPIGFIENDAKKIIAVGRNDDNDIVIEDSYVGRNHCKIIQNNDSTFTIVDLNSTNGTYVNGIRISDAMELHMNDIVRIGNTTLSWQKYFIENDDVEQEPEIQIQPEPEPEIQIQPEPQTISFRIKREKSFIGCAMPFRIIIDGKEVTKLSNGGEYSMQLPNKDFMLKVYMCGNAITIHKVEAETLICPSQYNGKINCTISVKPKLLGILSMGLLSAPGTLEFNMF